LIRDLHEAYTCVTLKSFGVSMGDELKNQLSKDPALYVVATPIGNMSDITIRSIDILKGVDVVAAEDTRVTRKLLSSLNIRTRLISHRQHNEGASSDGILDLLASGKRVALVSDAGTPGISDPGGVLVSKVRTAGYKVIPVPGVSAVITLLSVGGVSRSDFRFAGFLPSKTKERREVLQKLSHDEVSVCVFESPHRISDAMEDICHVFGPNSMVVFGREMTKLNEEIISLSASKAVEWVRSDAHKSRGEFTVLIIPNLNDSQLGEIIPEHLTLLRELIDCLPLGKAASIVAKHGGYNRKDVYELGIKMKESR